MWPDSVEPLEGSVESHLNPAWRACDGLASVVVAPALDETDADRAHLGELKDGIVAFGYGACQDVGEFVVREDLEITAWWELAYCGWMPAVHCVAVGTLYKDGTVT